MYRMDIRRAGPLNPQIAILKTVCPTWKEQNSIPILPIQTQRHLQSLCKKAVAHALLQSNFGEEKYLSSSNPEPVVTT